VGRRGGEPKRAVMQATSCEQFTKQLSHPHTRHSECAPAGRRDAIDAANTSGGTLLARAKIPATLKGVEDRVQRSCTQSVSVTTELFDHLHAEDGLFGRVVEHMQSNEPCVECPILDSTSH
jgi:hypothetical protein